MQDWVQLNGEPDVDFLSQHFGESEVRVTDTAVISAYGEDCPLTMSLSEYVIWWKGARDDGRMLYVKDWHFAAEHPHYKAYSCPPLFCDDWLNEWLDSTHACHRAPAGSERPAPPPSPSTDGVVSLDRAPLDSSPMTSDYRFVYLGPKGTSTPLHHDVLMSHSWSVNIAGVKHWTLVPPSHSSCLRDPTSGRLARGLHDSDGARFPDLPRARAAARWASQGPGEAIFVPSGWHHEVANATHALSINHNWVNAHAMPALWALLTEETVVAERLIDDCRALCSGPGEFRALVQRNVAANVGLGWADLAHMLRCAAGRRGASAADADSPPWRRGRTEAVLPWLARLEREQRGCMP